MTANRDHVAGDGRAGADEAQAAQTRYLSALLSVIRRRLERCAKPDVRVSDSDEKVRDALHSVSERARSLMRPAPIDIMGEVFGLSRFERDILLLCVGAELDRDIAALCGSVQGAATPTFGLALLALPEAGWGALAADAPLRRYRVIELGPGDSLVTRPMRIDEAVLHYLLGIQTLDERLLAMIGPASAPDQLPPSQRAASERLARLWASGVAVALHGASAGEMRAIAAHAGGALGLSTWVANAGDLPDGAADQSALARLWERQSALTGCALIVDATAEATGAAAGGGGDASARAASFVSRLVAPAVIASDAPVRLRDRAPVQIAVRKPRADEQRALWRQALGPRADELAGEIDDAVAQFDLSGGDIAAVAAALDAAGATAPDDGNGGAAGTLWTACRAQARPALDGLAQRIEPRAAWDDLILGERPMSQLREVAAQVRQRVTVYERWGFAGATARGLSVTALFAGASGTGKTTAAEVLARELELDLYRIDLSAVVSKYIGETEKNLSRVFTAAEGGAAILLFDEADALFGKRGEVRDSRDRYANMEVSYLLQRMESYRGLAILTTNLRDGMDAAFTRRIRFIVEFPFPSHADRAAMWTRAFPADAPTRGLNPDALARLNLSGGSIRNVALTSAFLAAEEGTAIEMRHVREAARSELMKLERPINETIMRGWQ